MTTDRRNELIGMMTGRLFDLLGNNTTISWTEETDHWNCCIKFPCEDYLDTERSEIHTNIYKEKIHIEDINQFIDHMVNSIKGIISIEKSRRKSSWMV